MQFLFARYIFHITLHRRDCQHLPRIDQIRVPANHIFICIVDQRVLGSIPIKSLGNVPKAIPLYDCVDLRYSRSWGINRLPLQCGAGFQLFPVGADIHRLCPDLGAGQDSDHQGIVQPQAGMSSARAPLPLGGAVGCRHSGAYGIHWMCL